MFTREFWIDTVERSLKTAAQGGVLYVGAQQINAWAFDWLMLLGYMVGGFALSVITSVASYNLGNRGTASFTKEISYTAPADE